MRFLINDPLLTVRIRADRVEKSGFGRRSSLLTPASLLERECVRAHVRVRRAGCVALNIKYDRVISRYSNNDDNDDEEDDDDDDDE